MTASDPVAERIVLEFLRRYAEDARRGVALGVEHYQALYPQHAARIALEWDALQQPEDNPTRRLGPYRLHEVLGRGGQGVVHRAVDERIGRTVALKLLPGLAGEDGLPARVQREVEAIARLDHPGLGVVYEAGVLEGQVFLAMRYVPGRSLAELMSERSVAAHSGDAPTRGRRDRLRDDVGLVEKLARALHTAHEAGVVHRDVKPANVMIHESGEPVLLDFGLARADDSELATLTASGELLGTTAYMAPERLSGEGSADRRVDVWSLGVLLYELLTGRRPFEGPGMDELSRRIRVEEPSDPRRLERGIPRDLAVVLGTALEKDLGRRYPTALDFAEELARVRAGRPVHAKPPNPLGRLRRWAWRHQALAALTLVVLAALIGSAWAALAFSDLADAERESRESVEALNTELQTRQQELVAAVEREQLAAERERLAAESERLAATRERDARRAAEALLVQRGAERAELLQLNGALGRRWEMLDTLAAAAATRTELAAPLPDDLPSRLRLRNLATSALLTPDARHDRVIQRSSLGAGRFSKDASRLALTWVAPDFQSSGVRILNTSTGAEELRMDASYLVSNSFSVTLAEDGAHLVIPRSDAISVWRTRDAHHAQQVTIPEDIGPTDKVSRWEVAFFPGERYLVGVGAPGHHPTLPAGWAIWDLGSGDTVQSRAGSPDMNDWLAFAPDDSHLLLPVSATRMQLLRLPVSAEGAPKIAELEAPAEVRAALLDMGADPEVTLLLRPADSPVDEIARMALDGELLARRALPARSSEDCGLLRRSPDGATLALATEHGDLLLLDAQDLSPRLRIPAHSPRRLEDLRFSADGNEVLSHSPQEGSDAWELVATPGLEHTLPLRPQKERALAWSGDGQLVAALPTGHRAPSLSRPDGSTRDLPRLELPDGAAPLELLALDATGARVAAVAEGAAWLWTLPDARPTSLPCPDDGTPLALAFGPDGAPRLLTRRADGNEELVRLDTGEAHELPGFTREHWITPDASLQRALLVSREGERAPLRLVIGELAWCELPAGSRHVLPGVSATAYKQVFGARLSHDGKRLAAIVYVPLLDTQAAEGVDDCQLMLWDLEHDTLLWSAQVDPQVAHVAPALGQDGALVLTAELNGAVSLRDGANGEVLLRWQAHTSAGLQALEILGSGTRVSSRSAAGEVKTWELAELRRQLAELALDF
ncbi:MAG: hypothetical protein DHS20C15_23660 [Planctomycetota bacterium]|nr:MAG: hypothetical protein DHS20C15_23660 [Planctomycetota bacterium]